MDRTERFYRIRRLIDTHKCVPARRFLEELEVSLATFKRDVEYMRNRLHVPIAWSRERNGYILAAPAAGAQTYELPGLWFNPSEIHALLTMLHLLRRMEPGILAPHVNSLRERLTALLETTDHSVEEIEKRVRMLHMTARKVRLEHFEMVATGLLRRKRLHIVYFSRGRNEETEREVSPQRLVHYRDNWYLDAWCHASDDLRIFALDCMRAAQLMNDKAKAVPDKELAEALEEGYGIFSGRARATATIRFSPARARWVSGEEWHPKQVGRFEPDGSWVLELPYSDDRELLMDILRHVPEVEVLGPPELKQRLNDALRAGLERNT